MASAIEIQGRFDEERVHIGRYVNYLRERSVVNDESIFDLNHTLKGHKLPELATRAHHRTNEPFSTKEIFLLLESLNNVTPIVLQTMRTREREFSQHQYFLTASLNSNERWPVLTKWITHLMETLPDDPTTIDIEKARYDALRQSRETDSSADNLSRDILDEIIGEAADAILFIKDQARRGGLGRALEHLTTLQLTARLASPDAEINLLRQGFLLLMTAFDAVVFDLVRVALRRKFFALIAAFGKQDKLSLHEIAELGSFDAMQEEIIEEQLKKRYLGDLLCLLANDWNVECTGAGDKFERLLEFVLRRNVHVHNRGIVDERYLDENKNLDRLKLGDVAVIDQGYWELANRVCGECVNRLALWADA